MGAREQFLSRVQRIRATIASDEAALRLAEEALRLTKQARYRREISRLREDLRNRRAYVAELLAGTAGHGAAGPCD